MEAELEKLKSIVRAILAESTRKTNETDARADDAMQRAFEGHAHVPRLSQPFVRQCPIQAYPFGDVWDWGIDVNGAVVTVYPGTIEYSDSRLSTLEASITITDSGQYIALELNRAAGTATITGPHDSYPENEESTYRTALYVFDLDNGLAVLTKCRLASARLQAIV